MAENSERGSKPVTGRDFRPASAGHVWAWIIIATCSVIFLSITMWVVSVGRTVSDELSDREVIHRLAQRMVERWPQVPGPPELYESQAVEAMQRGDSLEAARRSTMALALAPNGEASWIRLIVASSESNFVDAMISREESESVLTAIESVSGPSFDLRVAQAWLAFGGGSDTPLLDEFSDEKDTLYSALLGWRKLGDSADKRAIERVLSVSPGHAAACTKRIEIAHTDGDLEAQKKWTNQCLSAGVALNVTKSTGETLDSTTVPP